MDFIRRLRDIAESHIIDSVDREAFKNEFESLELKPAESTSYTSGESRSFKDLMTSRFKLLKVQRIDANITPKAVLISNLEI
jgi:hypothetical protein